MAAVSAIASMYASNDFASFGEACAPTLSVDARPAADAECGRSWDGLSRVERAPLDAAFRPPTAADCGRARAAVASCRPPTLADCGRRALPATACCLRAALRASRLAAKAACSSFDFRCSPSPMIGASVCLTTSGPPDDFAAANFPPRTRLSPREDAALDDDRPRDFAGD